MQAANPDLPPPQDNPITMDELRKFDGSNPALPIYVAIKENDTAKIGTVFDVSKKQDIYGAGGSYNVFAGKDASKALGSSSTKRADAISDYSSLDEKELEVLAHWYKFFSERYPIVFKVIDLPKPGSPEAIAELAAAVAASQAAATSDPSK